MKRFFALLLVAAMILGMMPGVFATESTDDSDTTPLTDEDYALADLMWEAVTAKEASMLAKKAPVSKTVEALIATVTTSPYYEEDSLIRNGDHFFWETTDGIPCGYSPRLSAMAREEASQAEQEAAPSTGLSSQALKNSTTGKNVYLFQPYYGIDRDFTTQYVTESQRIATALGGTATTYRTTNATIDAIANAMEEGAVVIFDSHGDTDYVNPNDSDDYATRANTSYICLQTGTGLTSNDYQKVTGPFGSYYHAYYAGSYGEMNYYCVDGTTIANHMDKNAPNNLLWMALCLSMATDGLHAPLMQKGVAVAYGYSQSVTFDYDYAWEEVFWGHMLANSTVADAISAMKDEIGPWDWCHHSDYDSLWEAREYYCAFPIVVSAQDPYPGHGNVDNYQAVVSTWKLFAQCPHKPVYFVPEKPATCTEAGYYPFYECNLCEELFLDEALTLPVTMEDITVPPLGHDYGAEGTVVPPDCTNNGFTYYPCSRCDSRQITDLVQPTGHSFVAGYCTSCGTKDYSNIPVSPFVDVQADAYYFDPVIWAVNNGITTGTSATTFSPEKTCTRGQVVTFLWRACGSPEPTTTENPFDDISPDAYYYKAVLWAVEKGITQGTGKGKFSPDKGCTRGQVATFLWRAQGEPTPTDSTNPFSDVAEGDYYYTAVLWAVENNITQGTGKGKFSPDNSCTRGQIVTFLYRALAQ